jgi:hypothetical protein
VENVSKEVAATDATMERRKQDLYERKRLLEKAISDLEALVEIRARLAPVGEAIEKPRDGG